MNLIDKEKTVTSFPKMCYPTIFQMYVKSTQWTVSMRQKQL